MAGESLGTLGFDLELRSKIDQQLKEYQNEIDKTGKSIDILNRKLKDATLSKEGKKGLEEQLKKAEQSLRSQQSVYKNLETRMQQVLDKGHEISNIIKTITSSKGNIQLFDNSALKSSGEQIAQIVGLLNKVFAVGADGKSPFLSGVGFKQILGDAKRGISDLKKDIGGLASSANKAADKATKKIQKEEDKAAKAEDKAVEYYRTRKQRVDDAINALSKRQAQYATLAEKSSADDARMLKAAGEQAEILKQRLLAAKTEYEAMQRLKGQGVPGAALSRTFLGKYTGMSELFGREAFKYGSDTFRNLLGGENAKADNLSYNDFISKQKEIVELTKQHNAELQKQDELQSRVNRKKNPLENRHIDISSEIRAQKDLNSLQEKQARNEIAVQKAIDKTAERYVALGRVIRDAQAARSGTGIKSEREALTAQIARVNEMRHALRAELNSDRGYSINLYNRGEAKIAIDNLKELTRAQEGLNNARNRQYDKFSRDVSSEQAKERAEAERIYQKTIDKTIADQQRREKITERSFVAEQNAIDKTAERYAKLRAVFSEGLSVRNNSNSLGVEADRLTVKLRELLPMVLELRQAYNAGTYSSNLFNKGDAKVLVDDVVQLTRAYKELNREKEKEPEIVPKVKLSSGVSGFSDTKGFIQDQIDLLNKQKANLVNLRQQILDTQEAIKRTLGSASSRADLTAQLDKAMSGGVNGETRARKIQERIDLLDRLNMHLYNLGTGSKVPEITEQIGQLDTRLERLASTMKSLPSTGGNIDLGKTLGLRNDSGDWFEQAKRAAQAQEAHLAKEKEITEAFAQEARNIEKVNQLLAIRAHRSQMEASRPSLYREGLNTRREAEEAVTRSRAEAEQIEHARELARLKEDIIRRSKQEEESLRAQTAAAREYSSAVSSLASSFRSLREDSKGMSKAMSDIKMLALQGGGVYMAKDLFDQIVQHGGMIEQQHIALRSMIGDYQEADKLFSQIKMLAVESPFTFSEMVRNTKQLVAYGIEEDKVYDTTKRLSDISAGLGVSVERLALAFGQVKARGWLDAKELRQFAYAGLPLTTKLSTYYTKETGKDVSPAEVMKMIKARKVAFTDVQKVLWELTDKGGQFYNMQGVLTDTLLGKFNKLKDAWDIMLSDFTNGGNVVGGVLKGILDVTADIIQNMNKIAPLLVGIGSAYGIRKLTRYGIGKLGLSSAKSLVATARQAMVIEMRKYAAMQQERVLSGEISMISARDLVNKRLQTMQMSIQNGDLMRMLALQGQLKPMELASWMANNNKTLTQKKQNVELLRQLELMGAITKAEARSIYYNNRRSLLMQQGKSWIGGLFTKGNIAMVGLSGVMAGASKYNEIVEQNKQAAEEMAESMKNSIKSVEDAISAHGDKPLTSRYIGSLEEVLRQSNLYSSSLGDQINKAGTLGEKYEIIKNKIREIKFIQEHKDLLGNMSDAATMGVGINDRIKSGKSLFTSLIAGGWSKFMGIMRGFNGFDLQGLISSIRESETKINDLGSHGVRNVKAIQKEVRSLNSTWKFMADITLPSVMRTMEAEVYGFGHSWKNMNIQARRDFKATIYSWIDSMGEAGTEIGARMFATMMMMKTAPDMMKDPKNMVWRKGSKSALSVWGHYYYNHYAQHYVPKTKEYSPDDVSSGGTGRSRVDRIHAAAQRADNATMKALNARLKLINDAYSIYKKYYEALHNEDAAAEEVRKSFAGKGLSNDDITKIKSEQGLRSLVEDYIERVRNTKFRLPAEMKDRKDEAISAGVEKEKEIDFRITSEKMDDFSKKVSKDISDSSRKFEAYKTILNATGDRNLAATVSGYKENYGNIDDAYGNRLGFVLDYSKFLKSYIDNMLIGTGAQPVYEDVLKMDDAQIEKYAGSLLAGRDNSKISGLILALKKFREVFNNKDYQDGINTFAELMKKIIDTADETKRIDADYQMKLNNLGNANITYEEYKKAKGVLDAEHNDALLKASDEYKQFMNFVGSMTKSGARKMYEKALSVLNERYKQNTITLKEYTDGVMQLDEQMQKFNDVHSNGYAFATGGLQGLFQNMISKGIATGNAKMKAAGMSGASSVAMVDAIVNGINTNVQAYKNLENTWTDAFGDGLKDSKFSNFMGGFTEASQGAADAWNSLKNGNFVGVFDGVVRSFTGWFSWGNSAANKRWQEQAEYLKGFQSTLNKINSNLESKISPTYGSQAISSAREYKENLSQEASEIRKTAYDWSQAHSIHRNHRNRMYAFGGKGETKNAFKTINETLRKSGYTGPEIGGDTIQNLEGKWLEVIRDKHAGLWGKMDSDLQGYLERLIDIENETGDVKKATEKLAETLSGLSVDGLLSDYESLIESFEATNTDFADDFEKKLKKAILSSMIANLYKDQIDNLVQEAGKAGSNEYYLSKDGTVKKHAIGSDGKPTFNEKDIASEYTQDEYEHLKEGYVSIGNSVEDTGRMLRDAFGWTNGSANSTSSSIKGMTEQTADLSASYLNAIRADVSVIRQLTIPDLDSINMTAKAQLQQLNQIAANTALNAEIAGRMETAVSNMNGILESVKNGSKTLSVKVQ